VLFLACITIKNRFSVPLPLERGLPQRGETQRLGQILRATKYDKLSEYGCLVNSIYMRRGAPWEHESSVAKFDFGDKIQKSGVFNAP
jgi:hypothetical protein